MSIELLQMRTIQGQIYDIGTIPSECVFDKMSDMCTTINLNLDRMIMFELKDCRMGETPPGYIIVRGSEVSMIWHTPYFPAEVNEYVKDFNEEEKGTCGMAVREHKELDKVLNAMNGYLDHVSQEQETKE